MNTQRGARKDEKEVVNRYKRTSLPGPRLSLQENRGKQVSFQKVEPDFWWVELKKDDGSSSRKLERSDDGGGERRRGT